MCDHVEMAVSETKSNSARGRAIGLIMSSLMYDEGEDAPQFSGWDLWNRAKRWSTKAWDRDLEDLVSYDTFKTALKDLEASQYIRGVGRVPGRSRTAVSSKIFIVTDAGYDWFVEDGEKFIGHPDDQKEGPAVAGVEADARALLMILADGKTRIAKKGSAEAYKARKFLTERGFIQTLIRITPEGRAWLEGEDNLEISE